jgi:heme-degrading monooxygenase HmoA
VSLLIAEVHHIKVAEGAAAEQSDETNALADKAAHVPGSEQLLTLMDASTGEGLVIHLWKDQAAYESFAAGRKAMTTDAQEMGSEVDSGRLYEVTYRS